MSLDAGAQLRANGAEPLLLATFEQEITEPLVREFDRKLRAIGNHLVSRGLGDEWPDLFAIAYPNVAPKPGTALRYLETGKLD